MSKEKTFHYIVFGKFLLYTDSIFCCVCFLSFLPLLLLLLLLLSTDKLIAYDLQEKCSKDYKYIELRVSSNHGDPTHTCIYRFRVHGKPPPGPALLAPKQSIDKPPE